jgi:transposase
MDAIQVCVARLDVLKATVVACVRWLDQGKVLTRVKTFMTMTRDLLELADWLQERGVTHVAMESTGVYWKPVFHLLEGRFQEILLVNAQHIKNVPGRKADVKDCEWIAQ